MRKDRPPLTVKPYIGKRYDDLVVLDVPMKYTRDGSASADVRRCKVTCKCMARDYGICGNVVEVNLGWLLNGKTWKACPSCAAASRVEMASEAAGVDQYNWPLTGDQINNQKFISMQWRPRRQMVRKYYLEMAIG